MEKVDAIDGLMKHAKDIGKLDGECLDDHVIDVKCAEASTINNSGTEEQMSFLLDSLLCEGIELSEAVKQIKGMLDWEAKG